MASRPHPPERTDETASDGIRRVQQWCAGSPLRTPAGARGCPFRSRMHRATTRCWSTASDFRVAPLPSRGLIQMLERRRGAGGRSRSGSANQNWATPRTGWATVQNLSCHAPGPSVAGRRSSRNRL